MSFKKYLKTLPIVSRETKDGIRVVLAPRAIHWTFPKISAKEIQEAIKWLKVQKLEIPYGQGQIKELVKNY